MTINLRRYPFLPTLAVLFLIVLFLPCCSWRRWSATAARFGFWVAGAPVFAAEGRENVWIKKRRVTEKLRFVTSSSLGIVNATEACFSRQMTSHQPNKATFCCWRCSLWLHMAFSFGNSKFSNFHRYRGYKARTHPFH